MARPTSFGQARPMRYAPSSASGRVRQLASGCSRRLGVRGNRSAGSEKIARRSHVHVVALPNLLKLARFETPHPRLILKGRKSLCLVLALSVIPPKSPRLTQP